MMKYRPCTGSMQAKPAGLIGKTVSGNIGIHHIHHLSNRIPNYRLGACLADIPALRTLNRIGLRESLSCIRLALWDEGTQRLISFKNLRHMQVAAAA